MQQHPSLSPGSVAHALVLMARPTQIALIGMVYGGGVMLGLAHQAVARPASLVGGGIALLLAALAVHWANEYADLETDRQTQRTPFSGGSGVLPALDLDRAVALKSAYVATLAALVAAALLHASGLLPLAGLVIFVLGIGGGLAYSLPPLAFARRGLGEVLNAALGGVLLPLYGVAAVAGRVEPRDALAFAPFAIVVFLSVMGTAWPDRQADAAAGKMTLQTRLRPDHLRAIHAFGIAAFLLAIVTSAATDASPFAAASIVVLPLLIVANRHYTTGSPLPGVTAMVVLAAIGVVVPAARLM